jgi:hypothetical protein
MLFVAISMASLGGCATTYTDGTNPITGMAGGYYDLPGPGKLVTVGFGANGYTEAETVRRYVLRRACEVVKEQGKTHFLAFVSLGDAARNNAVGEDLGINQLGGKPFSMIYILPLDEARPGAMDAADVLSRVTVEKEG